MPRFLRVEIDLMRRSRLLCLLFALCLCALPAIAHAQRVVTADEVNAVSKGLYCPVCENEPLDACGTQACQDWRDEVRMQLEAGRTQAEIYADFRARYGDRVLAQPPADGFNLVLWVGLPLLFVVGAVGFGRYLRSIVTKPAPVTAAAPSPRQHDDPWLQRIEDELRQK
jgi:cytochrome c-type biogenesis protein CcmH